MINHEILEKLSYKIISHFPKNDSISGFDYINQEPHKGDFFEIFKEAFNHKNSNQTLRFESFMHELDTHIETSAPYVLAHPAFPKTMVDIISTWNEWLYFVEKLEISKL